MTHQQIAKDACTSRFVDIKYCNASKICSQHDKKLNVNSTEAGSFYEIDIAF